MFRTLARIATALAAFQFVVSIYVLFAGGIRLQLGAWRISAGTWRHPFTQAVVLALVAAVLFHRDARARGEWDAIPQRVRRWIERLLAPIRQQPWLWGGVAAGAIAALIVCNRIAAQEFVFGSVAGGWTYPYVRPAGPPVAVMAALVSALACALLLWRPREDEGRGEWWRVGVWIVVATGLHALLRSLTPFSFESIFLSEGANSFYTVTQRHGPSTVLADFTTLRDSWPLHAHSNMPGKLMVLYALELISNNPAVLAWLMVAVANLGGVLLYLFVRDLFGDRRVALYALALYLFVPARVYFFPLMTPVTPVVMLACMVLFQRCLQRASLGYAIAAGVSLYVLIFYEPIPLVVGALVALILARSRWRRELTATQLMKTIGPAAILAFVATFALVYAVFGFNLVDAFRRVAADAAAFNAAENRPYGVWVWRNLVEFAAGMGICQVVLFVVAAVDGLRDRTRFWLDRPIVIVSAALLVMLLALDLAGVNRGEAIRLWTFLACLFQIPAAYVCARLNSRVAISIVLTLSVVQAALGTATVGFVVP